MLVEYLGGVAGGEEVDFKDCGFGRVEDGYELVVGIFYGGNF